MRSATATPPGVTWQDLAERPSIVAIRNRIERHAMIIGDSLEELFEYERSHTLATSEDIEAAIRLVKWTRGL